MRGLVVLAAVALAGCDQAPKMWTRAEIEKIVDEQFPFVGNNTEMTMENHHRIIALERENEMLQRRADAMGSAIDDINAELNRRKTSH